MIRKCWGHVHPVFLEFFVKFSGEDPVLCSCYVSCAHVQGLGRGRHRRSHVGKWHGAMIAVFVSELVT